jgi:hypothetical protein
MELRSQYPATELYLNQSNLVSIIILLFFKIRPSFHLQRVLPGFSFRCFPTRLLCSFHIIGTKRRGRVVNTHTSYSGGPVFGSPPGDRLS